MFVFLFQDYDVECIEEHKIKSEVLVFEKLSFANF